MLNGKTDAQLGYFVLRTALGVDLFGHGFVRLAGNYSSFHDGMVAEFTKSILPEILVSLTAWAIPPVELILGGLLILGFRTREALLASGLLMLVLIFGSSMIQNWGAVGIQLSHTLIISALLAFRSHNAICIDSNRPAHFHT